MAPKRLARRALGTALRHPAGVPRERRDAHRLWRELRQVLLQRLLRQRRARRHAAGAAAAAAGAAIGALGGGGL